MQKSLYILLVIVLMINLSWSGFENGKTEEQELLKIDRELSKKNISTGIIRTLLDHLSEDGMVLPLYGHPVIGKKSLQTITSNSDLEKTPPWTPTLAYISQAGDLGYTVGRYKIPRKKPAKETEPNHGYYCLIWRKSSQGKWKIVLCRGLLLGKIANQKPPHLNQKGDLSADENDLIKTEHEFSKYSLKKGIAAAFFTFMDENGIALSASGPPQNKDFYLQQMKQKPKKGVKSQLQWYPIYTEVSTSGDLGYNLGPYEYTVTGPDGKTRSFYGYFMTIWKKQADGTWKFLFDGGNQSPSR